MVIAKQNYRKANLKKKVFVKGASRKHNFKRFRKQPKFIKDNPENQIAREKDNDPFHFTDDEEDDADDLGMGLDLSDLPFLDDNYDDKQQGLIALTQDSVRPLFANNSLDDTKLEEGLSELNYKAFRPNQYECITRILQGHSTLFISPTGSGKSLGYQLPALLYWRYRKYITIVVSPLISLMEDQMKNMPSVLRAVTIHSGLTGIQRRRNIKALVEGEAQVVFISPEAIVGGLLDLDDLNNFPPVGFACIDEAHCLSHWSHNFRPAYLQFFRILNGKMKIKTFLGLTATATKCIAEAIANQLSIDPTSGIIGSTRVPENLMLSVTIEKNKDKALIELLQSPTFRNLPSIIVYCNHREETERLATQIRTFMQNHHSHIETPKKVKLSSTEVISGSSPDKQYVKLPWNAEPYHAGLSSDFRSRVQRKFIKGELRVVVATIAFGMGINKSNVRAIIHYGMPASFESYVQEVGRAGRDGKLAQCHMFLNSNKSDVFYQQRNIYASTIGLKELDAFIDTIFSKNCRCIIGCNKQELDLKNQSDPHYVEKGLISKDSPYTGRPTTVLQASLAETQPLDSPDEYQTDKENCLTLTELRESVLGKHRSCQGHELAFGIEEATSKFDLQPESIHTLLHELQNNYPQLGIEIYPPAKSTCTVFSYKGPEQMAQLETKEPVLKKALVLDRTNQRSEFGKVEQKDKIVFDYINVASSMNQTDLKFSDAMRRLKKLEWELIEETGRFRRTQAKVSFGGNSFHIRRVCDLNDAERAELKQFIYNYSRTYEAVERAKVANVYQTFRRHSIEIDKMGDKIARMGASLNMKSALNAYFERPAPASLSLTSEPKPIGEQLFEQANRLDEDLSFCEIASQKEIEIKRSARTFVDAHQTRFSPRAIARIFQGISTPNFPAKVWGTHRKWWRSHPDVDFNKLVEIIRTEIIK